MTVSTTACKVIALGNGAQTTFNYAFELPIGTSYALIYTDAGGNQTTLPLAAYSVSGLGSSAGGTFTYPLSGAPIAAGTSLTFLRQTPNTQATSLSSQAGYSAAAVEDGLDWIVYQVQQLAEQLTRTVQIPVVDTQGLLTTLPTAAKRAGAYAAFDSAGNLTAAIPAASASAMASNAMLPVIQATTTDAALASLGLSSAMRPIVYSSSIGRALNSLAAGGVITNTPSVAHAPQGNAATTLGSLVVQATTGWSSGREFLGSFSLYSNKGSAYGSGMADKVAMYAATEGGAGSGDVWSINSLTTLDTTFPATSFALGYECDFNNFAQDRGTTVGPGGFAGATSTGVLVTGSSTHWNTSGISVEGNNAIQWERGVSVINAGQASFLDWSTATTGLVMYGSHTYGIDLQPMTGAGGSSSAIRIGNTMALVGRNAASSADVSLLSLNQWNNIVIGGSGSSGVFINVPNLVPAADNATSLGISGLRWQQVWAVNGTIQTSDASLKTHISPLPTALPIVHSINPVSFRWIEGGTELVEDAEIQLVHATEETTYDTVEHEVRDGRAVQVSKTHTRHEHLYDNLPVHDAEGNPVMVTVAAKPAVKDATGVVIREAQPERTFQQTHRVPRMVKRAVPVTRRVSRPGRRNHLGFLAADVKAGLDKHAPGMDYGVYVKGEDGTEHLRPDQLVPVLWKAVQELSLAVSENARRAARVEAEVQAMRTDVATLMNTGRRNG